MQRTCSKYLKKWLKDARRKPLLLRGARQVGKTWLARDLAQSEGLQLIEFNFERNPGLADLFESNIYQGTAGIVLEVRPKIQQFSPSCIAVDFVEKQRGNWIEAWTGNSKDPNDRPKTKNNREFEWWIETGNHLWAFSSDIPADHTHSLYLSCRTLPHRVFVGSPSKLSLLPIQPTTNPSPATRP